ncbi:MAG: SpoIIE family protein phosphatase [Bacteroidetes bacterium]|nr:SpoIIE family protein phosphatase [Bacteroidota bacterium]MCA6443239.1 SpoIIE family protein phosphatase [Bacteroidota bacterium]
MLKLRHLIFLFIGFIFAKFSIYAQKIDQDYEINNGIENSKNANDSLIVFNNNIYFYTTTDLQKSIEWFKNAQSLFPRANNKILESMAYEYMADAYWYNNHFDKATEYYLKCNKIGEELGNKTIIAKSLYNLGWIKCFQLRDYKQVDLFYKSLQIFKDQNDTNYIITMYDALGNFYKNFTQYYVNANDSCELYYKTCIDLIERTKYKTNKAPAYVNLGSYYATNGNNVKARYYLYSAINHIRSKKNFDMYNYVSAYTMLIYTLNHRDSLKRLSVITDTLARYWYNPINEPSRAVAYEALYNVYFENKLFEKSLYYLKAFKDLNDSIREKSFNKNILDRENQYVLEKKDQELKELSLQNQISTSNNKMNRVIIYGLALFAVLVLVGVYFLFKSNKDKQKANELLAIQNRIISEKKLEIDQSINYAKGIQLAILPEVSDVKNYLKDSFVIYLPKDIVSGDFYWFQQVSDDEIVLACADCTGHGVPGSLMSIVSMDKLNLAVFEKKLTEPKDILFEINNQIKQSIKHQKDGLDIALLKINFKTNFISFSGANRPLWIVRNKQLLEQKATKKCIAGHTSFNSQFEQTDIQLQLGDLIVLSTDGYADQFGGNLTGNGKKMMTKRFKEVVTSSSNLTSSEMEMVLRENYHSWKGNYEQVDDVCVIGFKV